MKLQFIEQDIKMLIPTEMFPELKGDLSLEDKCIIEDLLGEKLSALGWTLYNGTVMVATSEL